MMKARDDGNKKETRKQVCDKLRKKIKQAENQPSQHLTRVQQISPKPIALENYYYFFFNIKIPVIE